MGRVDVDFSLALHNRTGKFFIGLDVLEAGRQRIRRVYYWKLPCRPPKFLGQVAGRLQLWQVKSKTGTARGIERLGTLIPRRHSSRPTVHLDPFTVPTTRLAPTDVVVCHDLGPLTHPTLFARDVGEIYRWVYEEIARIGPHLVFVSNTTRLQFENTYPKANSSDVRVIYPATRDIFSAAMEPVQVPGPYILTVGSIGDRKNQKRCIQAYVKSGLYADGIGYLVCGGQETGGEEVAHVAASAPGVQIHSYVTDGQLSWLYSNARGFVLASQLEGFGMPVAEAIMAGLVPVVSANSVLEEVAGDSAECVEPLSEDSIARGMRNVALLDEDRRKERVEKLQEHVAQFSLASVRGKWAAAFEYWSEYERA